LNGAGLDIIGTVLLWWVSSALVADDNLSGIELNVKRGRGLVIYERKLGKSKMGGNIPVSLREWI
jgi:hypothetical protein